VSGGRHLKRSILLMMIHQQNKIIFTVQHVVVKIALQVETEFLQLNKKEEVKMKNLKQLWSDECGQDLTEYALLLVLLTLAAIGSLSTLAQAINGTFKNAASGLAT
jgi:Flp pilus assembly pilin Flp